MFLLDGEVEKRVVNPSMSYNTQTLRLWERRRSNYSDWDDEEVMVY